MSVDFDSLVLVPCQKVFGDSVLYDSAYGGTFELSGVFDKAYESVVVKDGEAVSERMPVIGIRSAECATYPKQSDTLTITSGKHAGEKYEVREVRDDSHGNIKLMLNGPMCQ